MTKSRIIQIGVGPDGPVKSFDLKAYQKQYREAHREEGAAYSREYREKNEEALRAARHQYFQDNKKMIYQQRSLATAEQRGKTKEYMREYAAKNAAKLKDQRRLYRMANLDAERQRKQSPTYREKKREADRLYRLNNPDKYRKSTETAKSKKPDLYKEHQRTSYRRRRARLHNLPIEPVSTTKVIRRDKYKCHICLQPVLEAERSLDHLIPVVRGGALAEWNLMLAHIVCNKRRATKQVLTEETKEYALAYIADRNAHKEKLAA